ncbi:MAG TPA: glycine betaine ABC transporter substrate-binding protein [Mycobacteriales bacterium]|jgi:osmoprotectant transport system substrate-binding protein|nr:glycine betaine ABC transporter substrate-binding protein [Mycobacteriales bacterium]
MRLSRSTLAAALAVLPLALASCSDSGSDTATPATPAPGAASGASSTVCEPVAGDDLVALDDDKSLQASDNIVPVVRTAVLSDPLTTALDQVSAALDQEALAGLNKSTDVDRMQPAEAAAEFIQAQSLAEGVSGGSGPIRVVAANFSENQTLANLYAQVLKAAGFDATVVQLTNRELYEPALEKGEVDVVPEYAATLTDFLNKKVNGAAAPSRASGDIDTTVTALKELAAPLGLTPLTPAVATDQNAFAVTQAFADKYEVTSLSDLAAACGGGVTLGGPAECTARPYCQIGLQGTYGLKISSFTTLDAGGPLSKNALKTGKVALALVFSSDASLAPPS